MSYSYPDVLYIPGTGAYANAPSVICNAPKGATNQYLDVSYYGDSHPQPTGNPVILAGRFHLPSVVVSLSG